MRRGFRGSARRRDCTSASPSRSLACVVAWWVIRVHGERISPARGGCESARGALGGTDRRRAGRRRARSSSSGALAGLAGAIEVSGVTFALYENISPGYGFTAIAVALLARLDPLGGDRHGHRCSARSRPERRRCSATPVFRRSSCRSSKRGVILVARRARSTRASRSPATADAMSVVDVAFSKRRCAPRRRSRSRRSAKWSSSEPASSTSVSRASSSPARSVRSSVRRTAALAGGFAASMLCGVALALVFALFAVVWLRADQIITGTAITLLAVGLTGTLYRTMYGATGAALSIPTTGPDRDSAAVDDSRDRPGVLRPAVDDLRRVRCSCPPSGGGCSGRTRASRCAPIGESRRRRRRRAFA